MTQFCKSMNPANPDSDDSPPAQEEYHARQSSAVARITTRPDVFGGKPIIRDMRVSVELILSLLAQGVAQEDILDDYPDLSRTASAPASPTPTP